MKTQTCFFLTALVLAACFATAQMSPIIKADIPFSFIIEGKTYPAGQYELKENAGGNSLILTNTKTNEGGFANVITRLGARSDTEGDIVFDLVGNDHFLSEVYIPGMDGYLIKATPGKHTHAHIKARK